MSLPATAVKKSLPISLVFVSAYICQGIVQHFCLIAQPLNNFLKAGLRLDAANSAWYISLLMLPWVVKPIYGLASDAWQFAQAGRNRLRFLLWIHILAGLSYAAAATALFALSNPAPSWIALLVVALVALAGVGIAFATVVFVAMTVERSQRQESARLYFGDQALAYSCANIVAVFVGGLLCARLAPAPALSCALAIAAFCLLFLPVILKRLLESDAVNDHNDKDDSLSPPAVVPPETDRSLMRKLQALAGERAYLVTLLFLTLWNLSPNLGVSLYFFECDKLHFSQGFIGTLAACTSVGMLAGSIVFRYWLAQFFAGGRSTFILVALGVLSTLAYTMLSSPLSGIVIEFFHGFVTMIATLAIYGLAADVSPRGLTATAMAIQIAVFNLASEGSIALGGFLYGRVFGKELLPLIVVSSLTTLLTAFLIPFLTAAGCKQGLEPAG